MSAEKTLDILDMFDFDSRELTVPQLAEMLNQPQSSVYRHLRLLKEKGYLMEMNGGYYRLGYRFLKFAKIVRMDSNLSIIAPPIMRQLTRNTGETSILLVRSNLQAVCLQTVSSNQPIKVTSVQGEILPLYGGASSKALIAFLDNETTNEIVDALFAKDMVKRHTRNTIIDPVEFKQSLEEIKGKGYAFSDSELDEGVVSLGVPIFDFEQNVVASLSIAGPRERMLAKDEKVLVSLLQSAALEMQQFL